MQPYRLLFYQAIKKYYIFWLKVATEQISEIIELTTTVNKK